MALKSVLDTGGGAQPFDGGQTTYALCLGPLCRQTFKCFLSIASLAATLPSNRRCECSEYNLPVDRRTLMKREIRAIISDMLSLVFAARLRFCGGGAAVPSEFPPRDPMLDALLFRRLRVSSFSTLFIVNGQIANFKCSTHRHHPHLPHCLLRPNRPYKTSCPAARCGRPSHSASDCHRAWPTLMV